MVSRSGVAQTGSLPYRGVAIREPYDIAELADCQSAKQQTGSLRYERNAWRIGDADKAKLLNAVEAILSGYAAGTRFGIRQDEDSLLACGVPGSQLSWMDAKIGDWTV